MNKFILALFQRKHKLKSTTLYQVLIGRRTTSVLSYAYFNDLLPFFGSFPEWKESDFYKVLKELEEQGKISPLLDEPKYYQWIPEETFEELPTFTNLDYFQFGRKEQEAWHLVQFLTQVASYLGKSREYLPIESSPYYLAKTRQFVQQHKRVLKEKIYEELKVLFQGLSRETADLLSQTLTGYQQNGSAFFQLLPEDFQEKPFDQLYVSNHLHAFFEELVQHQDFLFYQFLAPVLLANQNQSAIVSRQLFQQGLSLEEIGEQRRLKKGTLHDHFIEWAMMEQDFPFAAFLTQEKYERLNQLPIHSWEKTYRELNLAQEISFFELRLYQIQEKRGVK